jgi:SNF2 family DNA or RNA helicase
MQGRPLLLAYEFIEDARRISERFGGVVLGEQDDSSSAITAFNRGQIPLLLVQPASAAYGLNLQEACATICFFGPTWNLEHYTQLIGRVWRQGQKAAAVVVHIIMARRTRDARVVAAIKAKVETQDALDLYLMS